MIIANITIVFIMTTTNLLAILGKSYCSHRVFLILCQYSHNISSQVKPVKSLSYNHYDLCGVYDIDIYDEK